MTEVFIMLAFMGLTLNLIAIPFAETSDTAQVFMSISEATTIFFGVMTLVSVAFI